MLIAVEEQGVLLVIEQAADMELCHLSLPLDTA